jgi:hypothetical protein
MKIEEIKKEINKKIVWYCTGITDIDYLVDFVAKIDPKYIYKFLENPKYTELGQVMDTIQDYDIYKENGNKKIVIDTIKDFYNKKLKKE